MIPPQFRTRDQLATKPSESPGEARTHGFTKGNQIFWSACTQAYLQVPSVLLSWSLSNCLVFCLLMSLCLSSWFSLIVAQVEWNVQLLHVLLLQLFSTAARQPNWSSGLNGSPQFYIPAIPCGWMVTPTHRQGTQLIPKINKNISTPQSLTPRNKEGSCDAGSVATPMTVATNPWRMWYGQILHLKKVCKMSTITGFLEVCLMIDVSFREYQKKSCLGKHCGPNVEKAVVQKNIWAYRRSRWPRN